MYLWETKQPIKGSILYHQVFNKSKTLIKISVLRKLLSNYIEKWINKSESLTDVCCSIISMQPFLPHMLCCYVHLSWTWRNIHVNMKYYTKAHLVELEPFIIRRIKDPLDVRFPGARKRSIRENQIELIKNRVRPFSQLCFENMTTCSEPMKAQKPRLSLLLHFAFSHHDLATFFLDAKMCAEEGYDCESLWLRLEV